MAPLTGTLAADFSSFQTAVEQSIVKLTAFEAGGAKVATSLDRATNALSGVKIVQQATIAAEAVERIGGASKLTDAELARVGATAQEAANKLRALGEDVPPKIQHLADQARGAAEETLRLGTAAKGTGDATEGLGSRITGLVAAAVAAKAAIQGIVATGAAWVTAAGEQENASVRLDTALHAAGTFTPQLVAQYDALAASFERTTTFSDELITEMEALLTVVGGVAPKDMKAALTASTDLAAGLRIDLKSATELVAKALEGNMGALKKHGIAIDETAFKTQGATVVFQAIADKMGGAATAQAATFGGEMARLGNVINNAEESLGGLIAKGLKPAVDAFLALPEPVRTGAITIGLLGGAAGTLAVAVAGVAAAIALAAPLLGFSAATAGTAAIGGLSTAATGLAAAFWPVSAAIAAVWVAWKIGNIEAVKNTIAEWTLQLQGMTAAEAHAAVSATAAAVAMAALAASLGPVAAATVTAAAPLPSYTEQLAAVTVQVGKMTTAEKEEVLAAKALGMNEDDLTKKFGLGHAALELLTKAHQDAEAALKKSSAEAAAAAKLMTDALTELSSAGVGWKGTLDTLTFGMQTAIRLGIEAGVGQGALATAYGLTATQVKAVATSLTEEAAALKIEQASILATAKLWEDVTVMKIAQTGTVTDVQIAAIDRQFNIEAAALVKSAANYRANYDALVAKSATAKEMVMTDFSAINQHSQKALQDIADKAAATFSAALASSGRFTQGYMDKLQATALATQQAADSWGQSLEGVEPKGKQAAEGIRDSFVGAFQVITMSADQMAAKVTQLLHDAQQNLMRGGVASTEGFIQTGTALRIANKMPSFATGGSGDFGSGTPVMLHGKESIVPWGQGGGAVIHAPISIVVGAGGSGAEAGRAAADALLERLKRRGVRI